MVNILLMLAKYGPTAVAALSNAQEFFALVTQAQSEGRDLTAEEMATIDANMEAAETRWAEVVAAAQAAEAEADTGEG